MKTEMKKNEQVSLTEGVEKLECLPLIRLVKERLGRNQIALMDHLSVGFLWVPARNNSGYSENTRTQQPAVNLLEQVVRGKTFREHEEERAGCSISGLLPFAIHDLPFRPLFVGHAVS